jgi:hypothetical protein
MNMKKMLVISVVLGMVFLGGLSLRCQDEGQQDEPRPGSGVGDMFNAQRNRQPVIVLCSEITGAVLKGVKAKKKSIKNGVAITFKADKDHIQGIKDALSVCKENAGQPRHPKAPRQLIGMRGVSIKLSETEDILRLEATTPDKKMARLIKSVSIKAKAKKEKKVK